MTIADPRPAALHATAAIGPTDIGPSDAGPTDAGPTGAGTRRAQAGAGDPGAGATAHERVYRTLRARLLAGDLAPGVSLTIRGVAAETGVSMTPAREAVRRLAAERALSLTASGRILVPTPDAAALGELFEARALLEPALAARAVAALDRGGRAALGARLRACDDDLGRAVAAGDAPGYVRANTAFHAALYTAAGAPALLALVESVWLQTAPTMRCVYAVIGTRALEDHHAGALRGLAKGDAATVACAIRADVAQGATLVAELAEKSASAPG